MDTATAPQARPLTPFIRRRDDFRDGPTVKLLDGHEWTFAGPVVRFSRALTPDGTRALASRGTFGTEYQAKLDELDRLTDAGDYQNALLLQLDMAAVLLKRNYDLTDDEVDSLIEFSWDDDDPDLHAMTQAIQAVIRGNQPVPKGDSGSGDAPA